jgi:CxxC-x17-CxxC domain-containing protein
MPYADKALVCRDCGAQFTFTASEQEFYASRGFENDPSRCPSCRAARKRASGRGTDQSRSYGSSRERPPRQMYPATCADCGVQTEVPFEPRGDRPVYCADCFRKQRASRY